MCKIVIIVFNEKENEGQKFTFFKCVVLMLVIKQETLMENKWE